MTIETLRYVYAAYQYGSYKEAAYALEVTYSVVAKQVARAEEELGVKLFERASKAKEMQLTPAGRFLIGELREVLSHYGHMEAMARDYGRTGRRKLRILRGFYLVCEEELDIMARFALRHPDVTLVQKCTSLDAMRTQLTLQYADGIFRAYMGEDFQNKLDSEFPAGEYVRQPISRVCQFHFVMSDHNPLAKRPALSRQDREELLKQTFLITSTSGGKQYSIPPYLERYLKTEDRNMSLRFIDSSNMPLLPRILEGGEFLLPLARRCTQTLPGLTLVPAVDWTTQVRLYFIFRKNSGEQALELFSRCAGEYADSLGTA